MKKDAWHEAIYHVNKRKLCFISNMIKEMEKILALQLYKDEMSCVDFGSIIVL